MSLNTVGESPVIVSPPPVPVSDQQNVSIYALFALMHTMSQHLCEMHTMTQNEVRSAFVTTGTHTEHLAGDIRMGGNVGAVKQLATLFAGIIAGQQAGTKAQKALYVKMATGLSSSVGDIGIAHLRAREQARSTVLNLTQNNELSAATKDQDALLNLARQVAEIMGRLAQAHASMFPN